MLTFKAETPISLTDGAWLLTSHNNGKGGVVSGAVDAEVTAVFGEDGTAQRLGRLQSLQCALHGGWE